MRILKRNLAFVLALVMALSLTAGAKVVEYTDHNDIAFAEAVEVMSAMGILEGTDGVFNPTKVLNRAEAAKIIAYMMLGEKTASNLKAAEAPFVDVPVNHWAAGYVAYCVRAGIVKGVSATEFAPKAELTATQFAAMLLRACGYAKNGEYEGFGWDVNVNTDALKAGIYENNLGVDFGAGATREEAALYAFNTLMNVKTVTYIKSDEYYVEGAKTLADTLYAGYTKVEKDDAFGRDGKVWKNAKGEEVTNVIADEAKKVYTENTKYKTIYADLGLTKATDAKVILNGKDCGTVKLEEKSTATTSAGNGTTIEAYVDADNNVTLVIVETKLGKVESYTEAKDDVKAYVTLVGGATFETETKYEKDDVVLYTMTSEDSEIQSMELAETVTGKVTAKVADKYIKLGGEKYNYGKYANKTALNGLTFAEATVAVDANGYVYAVITAEEEKIENVDGYVKVVDSVVAKDKFGAVTGGELKVKFFADGETVVVPVLVEKKDDVLKFKTVGTDDKAAWTELKETALTDLEGKVFGYTMTEDEEIVLHALSADVAVYVAETDVDFDGKRAVTIESNNYRLNAATVATVVEKEGVETFEGFEDIKFAATDVEVLLIKKDAMLKEIFVLGDMDAASNDAITVYYAGGDAEQITDDTYSIVLYKANGEKLVDVIVETVPAKGAYKVQIDTDNKITSIDNAAIKTGTVADLAKDGMSFKVGGTVLYVNEGVKVYNVTDGIKVDTLENGDSIAYTVDKDDALAVTEIFIVG